MKRLSQSNVRNLLLPVLLALTLFLYACAGDPDTLPEKPAPHPPPTEETDNTVASQKDEPSVPKAEEETGVRVDGEYVLSEEAYQETKRDLAELVQELNTIIASKDYQKWLSYLTDEYRDHFSSMDVLKEQSNSPLLKKYDIVLRSLRDYFHYVVVGSRQNVRLDEIKALDKDRVRAYMYINEKPVIIYELQKVDGEWKIGIID